MAAVLKLRREQKVKDWRDTEEASWRYNRNRGFK